MKMMNLVYNEATVLNNFLEKGECKIREDKIIMILIKYYYINEMTDFKVGFIFITLYGNIDYRKKENITFFKET